MTQANTMSIIEEIYEETETDITYEEFENRVEEKMEQMGGLVDEQSAALLIQNEVGDSAFASNTVNQIQAQDNEVEFTAKIVGIGNINTFDQTNSESDADRDENQEEATESDSNSEGRVCNITLRDETGAIRAALWNKMADNAVMEYEVGDTVTVSGTPREGYNGVEVNVDSIEPAPDAEIELDVNEVTEIADLTKHHEMVDISGVVLGTTPINTFERNDGSEGKVSNIVIGDGSGAITLTLWDDATEAVNQVSSEETIQVLNGNARTDDDTGNLVIHTGSAESIKPIDKEIRYSPDNVPIDSVQKGDVVTLKGNASVVEDINEFTRDDGSEGRVQNIEIKDNTGSIRVPLWGDDTREDLQPGKSIALVNYEIVDGWQDSLEAKSGYTSAFYILPEDSGKKEATPTGIGEYNDPADGDENPDTKETVEQSPTQNEPNSENDLATVSDGDSTPEDGPNEQVGAEEVEVKGTVVGTGEQITIDTNGSDETIKPPEGDIPRLGESITVRGTRTESGMIEATEIF